MQAFPEDLPRVQQMICLAFGLLQPVTQDHGQKSPALVALLLVGTMMARMAELSSHWLRVTKIFCMRFITITSRSQVKRRNFLCTMHPSLLGQTEAQTFLTNRVVLCSEMILLPFKAA